MSVDNTISITILRNVWRCFLHETKGKFNVKFNQSWTQSPIFYFPRGWRNQFSMSYWSRFVLSKQLTGEEVHTEMENCNQLIGRRWQTSPSKGKLLALLALSLWTPTYFWRFWKISHSSFCNNLKATAKWWFSSTDSSLYIIASSEPVWLQKGNWSIMKRNERATEREREGGRDTHSNW